jgi:hypothetical protein
MFNAITRATTTPSTHGTYEDLVGDNAAYAARVTRLEDDLTRERAISARLATLEGPGHGHEPKPEDIPDPDNFDGTRANLRPFLTKLRLKIAGNAARFPNVQHQLRYAFGFLKGDAYAAIEPHLANDRLNFATLDEFTEVLKMAFGDPDETRTATLELESLRQTNKEFSRYYADFQRLMAIVNYDERAKRAALERGLNKELKSALTLQDAPDNETFLQFVARVNRLDNRIRAHAQQLRSATTSNTQRPPAPRTTPAPVVTAPATPTTATGTHPGPMELNANRRRITPAERQRRIAQGLCMYCGGTGHFAAQCPAAGRRPDRLRGAEANLGQEPDPAPDHHLVDPAASLPQSGNE